MPICLIHFPPWFWYFVVLAPVCIVLFKTLLIWGMTRLMKFEQTSFKKVLPSAFVGSVVAFLFGLLVAFATDGDVSKTVELVTTALTYLLIVPLSETPLLVAFTKEPLRRSLNAILGANVIMGAIMLGLSLF